MTAGIQAAVAAGGGVERQAVCWPRTKVTHEDIWHVLVLSQQGQVQQDLNGLCVSCHDNKLRDTAVQGLGSLVGSLLQLLVVAGLLHDVHDNIGQLGISLRQQQQ